MPAERRESAREDHTMGYGSLSALDRMRALGSDGRKAACEWFGRGDAECDGCPADGKKLGCVPCAMLDAAGFLGGSGKADLSGLATRSEENGRCSASLAAILAHLSYGMEQGTSEQLAVDAARDYAEVISGRIDALTASLYAAAQGGAE